MAGAGRPFNNTQQVNRTMGSNLEGMNCAGRSFMLGLSIGTLSLMVGGSFLLGAAADVALSSNARLPAVRRFRPEPLACDSARLQELEANLEVERRYASTARGALVRAGEAQSLAEERLLQGEADLEAALQESASLAYALDQVEAAAEIQARAQAGAQAAAEGRLQNLLSILAVERRETSAAREAQARAERREQASAAERSLQVQAALEDARQELSVSGRALAQAEAAAERQAKAEAGAEASAEAR